MACDSASAALLCHCGASKLAITSHDCCANVACGRSHSLIADVDVKGLAKAAKILYLGGGPLPRLRMLSRRRRAFHLRRVMLAAGLWMKLRKRLIPRDWRRLRPGCAPGLSK